MERWSLATGAAVGQVTRTVAAIADARKTRTLVAAMVLCLDRSSAPGLNATSSREKAEGEKAEGKL